MKNRIQNSGFRSQNEDAENRFSFYSGFWILTPDFCFSSSIVLFSFLPVKFPVIFDQFLCVFDSQGRRRRWRVET